MSSISDMYQASTRSISGGVEGYHVDKKYVDASKMKQRRILETSKDRPIVKPVNVTNKPSFIDEIKKKEAKFPGPANYDPKQIKAKSKTGDPLTKPPHRKTIFDEMQDVQKKYNYPAAGSYDHVDGKVNKNKLKSDVSKSEKSSYLDQSMRQSLETPGVGNYNSYHGYEDHRARKWKPMIKDKSKSQFSVKLPPVGTYDPQPVNIKLFASISATKRSKPAFDREERFKKSKQKKMPFYNILSDWGIKNKRTNTDILTKISSPSSHRSVYH